MSHRQWPLSQQSQYTMMPGVSGGDALSGQWPILNSPTPGNRDFLMARPTQGDQEKSAGDAMSLWTCREQSSSALASSLRPLASLLDEAFARIDEAVEYFEKFLSADPAPAGRVCAMVTIKGRNLALGCYSLALDGLAQESGALLRTLLESVELLEYLRDVPGAVDQALDGTLPRAGKRAGSIGGKFQELREYLSNSASHLDFGPESTGHRCCSGTRPCSTPARARTDGWPSVVAPPCPRRWHLRRESNTAGR